MSERHAGGMPPSEHADWVLDLGPGGGVNGGEIVAEGTPEKVAAEAGSFTGQYLKPLLERASVKPQVVGSPANAGALAAKRTKPARSPRAKSTGLDEDQSDLIAAK